MIKIILIILAILVLVPVFLFLLLVVVLFLADYKDHIEMLERYDRENEKDT